jgi:hypothetical protein
MFVRGFQPKAPKLLRVIHCKIIFKSAPSGDRQRRSHGFFFFSSSAETLISLTVHSFIVKRQCYQRARESLEVPINARFFQQFVISKSCSLISGKLACGLRIQTGSSSRGKQIGLSGKPVNLLLSKFSQIYLPRKVRISVFPV